jgi:hypothetical protein
MIKGNVGFVPKLADGPPSVYLRGLSFDDWWTTEVIFWDSSFSLNRSRLVYALRHQDGGSHIGDLTDESYRRFKRGAGWYKGSDSAPPEPILNMVSGSMRQVAWEITETLNHVSS